MNILVTVMEAINYGQMKILHYTQAEFLIGNLPLMLMPLLGFPLMTSIQPLIGMTIITDDY
jgi:hypothetical protein